MCARHERTERLERVGFIAHRAATELREARERFPERDALAARLEALEHEARTIAGVVAAELRDAEDLATYGQRRTA